MIFTSLPFLLFFSGVLLAFVLVPPRLRWLLLLAASYFFYACLGVPHLLLVVAAVTVISFATGARLHQCETETGKKRWLWVGIAANLSILIWLRYLPFLASNLNLLLGFFPGIKAVHARQLVAVGASYYIFQGISYLNDIYLELSEPERHLGRFALYMSFFPKILQGPIERGRVLLPQLHTLDTCTGKNLRAGAHLFLWGAFKKVVVADRLASFVDPVYDNVGSYHGLSLVVATYLFALQIYFDFSGYTDMALGVARCFNIRLTQNFNSPYLATSTADFWRRWHISFSSWILDYIFKPLQMRLRDWPQWGTVLALLATFITSGAWHGASWNFLTWGALHGVYLGSSVLFKQKRQKLVKLLGWQKSRILRAWQIFATFHLVCFSWIFFRANSFGDALQVISTSVADLPRAALLLGGAEEWARLVYLGKSGQEFWALVLLTLLALGIGALDRKLVTEQSQVGELSALSGCQYWLKGCVYGVFAYLIAFSGVGVQGFIYSQF